MYREGYLVKCGRSAYDPPQLIYCVFENGVVQYYTEKGGPSYEAGEPRLTEFAAPTNDLMKEWANSLHLWRRMNWKENVKFFDNSSEISQTEELETLQLQMHTLKTVRGRSVSANKFRKPFVNIMHGQPSPTIKKFVR
ncbi:hypothetical protein PInf_020246 [Phytophthora infestans]|nr:hypothetical protein PInf_020246 [Phytophthora infestans]